MHAGRPGCLRRTSPTIARPPSGQTSATGPPTTSSPGARSAHCAVAADSRTSTSPATGSRSHAGWCPTRAVASKSSDGSGRSPACGTSPPFSPSKRAGATGWWIDVSRRLGPHVRPQRCAVGARRGGERARADRGRPRADRDRRRLDRHHARDPRAGARSARARRAPDARGTHARAQPCARPCARAARGTTRCRRPGPAGASRAPAGLPRGPRGGRAARHGRARGRRGRPRGRGHPSTRRRRRAPPHAHPPQSLRAFLGRDAPGRCRAGGRVRREAAGRAGLRPLDAYEPARGAGEPARAPRGAPPAARARHGGSRRRAAPRRDARALAGGAERRVTPVVRALRRAPGARAGASRRLASRGAAQGFVVASWTTPSETLWTNAICQLNLFEGMRQLGSKARFIVIGSSEEYGLVYPDELPVRETNPLRPLSPYAVSKVTQDLMGYQYFKSYGKNIVRARAFT